MQEVIREPLLHIFLPRLQRKSRLSAPPSPSICYDAVMMRGCLDSSVTGGKNIRWLSPSVCGASAARLCTLAVQTNHKADDTPQSEATGARRGVMLTELNPSRFISDIKGQAVSSRWSFCWTDSLFLDRFNSVQVESPDPFPLPDRGGNFHTATCASRRVWTHAQHNKDPNIRMR